MVKTPIIIFDGPPPIKPVPHSNTFKRIDNIVDNLVAVKQMREANRKNKEEIKHASRKAIENAIQELINNPKGLSRGELLGAADAENISATVLKIKRILGEDGKFTLNKVGRGSQTIYKIERVP